MELMDPIKPKAPKYIVLDLETTGLDATRDAIIEVGAIAIDESFGVIGAVDFVVRPNGAYQLKGMHQVVVDMHTANGLLEVCQDGLAPHDADEKLATWLRYSLGCEDKSVVLAGHTISFDHRFLKAQFPLTSKLLSHRTLDFSAIARLFRDLGIEVPNHEIPHRAMGDCLIELDEFQAMVNHLRDLQAYRTLGSVTDVARAVETMDGQL